MLDSAAANNSNRLNDTTTITTKGGILSLVGNGAGTMETAGTLRRRVGGLRGADLGRGLLADLWRRGTGQL